MKRMKKHKVKHEKPETSSSYTRELQDHDLAYYIHDRVELMHQVFSVLKPKDLKAMAPECIRRISIDDLQELCTEELLGISSKRLCAILDGAEPPSDTESSSASPSPLLETISLDSISSDEEILSQSSKKKKHKHKRRDSKSRKTKKKALEAEVENLDQSKASRAGLTVLELLELQARARAIRAQLQNEQQSKRPSDTAPEHRESDNDEVEIKEEPAEVVEISSEDEKPNIEQLQKANPPSTSKELETNKEPAKETTTVSARDKEKTKKKNKKDKKEKKKKDSEKEKEVPNEVEKSSETENPQTITKRINDLIITVPQQSNRKIKLNRNKVTVSLPNATDVNTENTRTVSIENPKTISSVVSKPPENLPKVNSVVSKPNQIEQEKKTKDKPKKVKKKDKRKNSDNSDQDEITLQLSDTEKMDLLEDIDRKDYEQVSSSDSESSSDSDSTETSEGTKNTFIDENSKENTLVDQNNTITQNFYNKDITVNNSEKEQDDLVEETEPIEKVVEESSKETEEAILDKVCISKENTSDVTEIKNDNNDVYKENDQTNLIENCQESEITENEPIIEISNINDIPLQEQDHTTTEELPEKNSDSNKQDIEETTIQNTDTDVEKLDINKVRIQEDVSKDTEDSNDDKKEKLSDGEISDKESSEVEAIDLKPEVVCISDDETTKKKKKKKEKKAKKDKKKSKSDFREGNDENFFKDAIVIDDKMEADNYDDVYEILELSDDSSCYEVEGTVLSKEPTAEEIEALSARIDEIKREDVVTDEQIKEHEREQSEKEIENISWKDRYLDSKKVKSVLSTSNILNALRKKNIELKKKMEESKKAEMDAVNNQEDKDEKEEKVEELEEGSIQHYNTLEGSTKFVDPVQEITESEKKTEIQVTGEMKKDAKQLLKMFKKLLKYNDINKQKDSSKKKKKKKKKEKEAAVNT